MPGGRPWKAVCAGVSAASDMTAVMVLSLDHVDGEERAAGVPGVGGSNSQIVVRRSYSGLMDDSSMRTLCEGFFERKLCAPAPMAAMPVGTVTLLGASFWLPSPR